MRYFDLSIFFYRKNSTTANYVKRSIEHIRVSQPVLQGVLSTIQGFRGPTRKQIKF